MSNAARVLVPWRPFLANFRAAIAAAEKSSMPDRVWTKQLSHALACFAAFLHDEHGSIVRRILLTHYLAAPDSGTVVTDASPWNLGGVLVVHSAVVELLRVFHWLSGRNAALHSEWRLCVAASAASGVLNAARFEFAATACARSRLSLSFAAAVMDCECSDVRLLLTCPRLATAR